MAGMIVNDEAVYQLFDKMANDTTFPLSFYDPLARKENKTLLFDISAIIDISQHYENLKLIYDSKNSLEQIILIDNLQKIFRKYFQINGIERLIATNYSDIEWSMFFEFDFKKSQPKYYRDHFVHQFRDAFLSLTLLNECNLHQNVMSIFQNNDTVISKYINNMIEKQKLLDNIGQVNEVKNEIYYGEILYKTTLLSAIFHDIGYPLSYFSRVSEQIENSLPFYKVVSSTGKTDFLNIRAMLADSLLFRTVKNSDIQIKYEHNDHGVLSAICFLLNFYHTGGISDLSPMDRCIIELAARSIYDHTNQYKDGQRITFNENPFSYLLRISDDLQEWSRFTLSVGQNSNAMVCQNKFETIHTENGYCYTNDSQTVQFLKTTGVEYKKLNYIYACLQLQLNYIRDENKNEIHIILEYDPYRLLELSAMNFSYSIYRTCELRQLEKMLPSQKELPKFTISYSLSNNIFYLAKEILNKFAKMKKDILIEKALSKVSSDKNLDDSQKKAYAEVLNSLGSKNFLIALKKSRSELKNQDTKTKLYYLSDMDNDLKKINLNEEFKRLTTNEYSNYLVESEKFLAGNLGFLGLLSLLTRYIG